MKLYLVTGGAGLIGSALIAKLLHEGHGVICIDNFVFGDKNNISKFLGSSKFKIAKTAQRIKKERLDGIFHLASPVTSKLCEEHHDLAIDANITMTNTLKEIAEKLKIPIVYASTIKVGSRVDYPNDLYVNLKASGESILSSYEKAKIMRMGNVYGPSMRKDDPRVLPTFLRTAPKFTIYGDGKQKDSFCYVDDAIDAMCKLMESDYYGIIEIGSDEAITIIGLANLITKIKFNGSIIPTIIYADSKKFIPSKVPNIQMAKSVLNWEPSVSLKEGIKKMVLLW